MLFLAALWSICFHRNQHILSNVEDQHTSFSRIFSHSLLIWNRLFHPSLDPKTERLVRMWHGHAYPMDGRNSRLMVVQSRILCLLAVVAFSGTHKAHGFKASLVILERVLVCWQRYGPSDKA